MDDIKLVQLQAENAELKKRLDSVAHVLSEPLIIMGEHGLRPVKGTSRQDVYTACIKAQMALGMQDRWFPDWSEGGRESDG